MISAALKRVNEEIRKRYWAHRCQPNDPWTHEQAVEACVYYWGDRRRVEAALRRPLPKSKRGGRRVCAFCRMRPTGGAMCKQCVQSYERTAHRDGSVMEAMVWAANRARRFHVPLPIFSHPTGRKMTPKPITFSAIFSETTKEKKP